MCIVRRSKVEAFYNAEIEITFWDDGDVTLEAIDDTSNKKVYLFLDINALKTAVDEVFAGKQAFEVLQRVEKNKGREELFVD